MGVKTAMTYEEVFEQAKSLNAGLEKMQSDLNAAIKESCGKRNRVAGLVRRWHGKSRFGHKEFPQSVSQHWNGWDEFPRDAYESVLAIEPRLKKHLDELLQLQDRVDGLRADVDGLKFAADEASKQLAAMEDFEIVDFVQTDECRSLVDTLSRAAEILSEQKSKSEAAGRRHDRVSSSNRAILDKVYALMDYLRYRKSQSQNEVGL